MVDNARIRDLTRLTKSLLAAARGDMQRRYLIAERVAKAIHPEAVLSERSRVWLTDPDFLAACNKFTKLDGIARRMDRLFMLHELAGALKGVEGDSAECGVYTGASSYMICKNIVGLKKRHEAFDSFEGLSQPSDEDGRFWKAADLASPEDVARENLAAFPFVRFHRGWIPTRFSDVEGSTFFLLHLDVDLYEPTRSSLEFFYDRVSPGGAIVCDDYGFSTCPGAKRAMDEFFEARPESILHLPTGQGLVFKK